MAVRLTVVNGLAVFSMVTGSIKKQSEISSAFKYVINRLSPRYVEVYRYRYVESKLRFDMIRDALPLAMYGLR